MPIAKTLKYRPGFPSRFGSIEDARGYCGDFFSWYNEEHRHSGLELLTPADVHLGLAPTRLAAREKTLTAAFSAHPARFSKGLPTVRNVSQEVWINKPNFGGAIQEVTQ